MQATEGNRVLAETAKQRAPVPRRSRIGVKQIELAEQHLREADSVADVLAVAWEIFDLVGALAAACAEQAADMYPAFMFARGAAVNGRNAVALAPSMTAVCAVSFGNPELSTIGVDDVADMLAALASALGTGLRAAARRAAANGDRIACESAARDADRISELLARRT